MGKWNTNQDITKLIYILWKYFSSWVLIVVVWLRITSTWIRIFVDFVFVPKWNSLILYVQHKKFHGVSKLRYSFNTLDKWAVELCNRKWNVDINVFIFSIFFFFYIYQLRIGTKSAFEFHNYRSVQISVILSNLKIKKSIWIILWAHTLAILINILNLFLCFTNI